MAENAKKYKEQGFPVIKVKLGETKEKDAERIHLVREAIGYELPLRIDANQGWSFDTAVSVLQEIGKYNIQFCEQPMRYWDDDKLPELRKLSPVKIMADESVYDHHDAKRLIKAGACDYVNIKFSKSGGLLEAKKINEAIVIFKLNVKEYPDSWNVYDSLGEAYMNNGENKLAIENYEKSVQLNPDNTGGKNMLKKLNPK